MIIQVADKLYDQKLMTQASRLELIDHLEDQIAHLERLHKVMPVSSPTHATIGEQKQEYAELLEDLRVDVEIYQSGYDAALEDLACGIDECEKCGATGGMIDKVWIGGMGGSEDWCGKCVKSGLRANDLFICNMCGFPHLDDHFDVYEKVDADETHKWCETCFVRFGGYCDLCGTYHSREYMKEGKDYLVCSNQCRRLLAQDKDYRAGA